jgi:hypothetical protein
MSDAYVPVYNESSDAWYPSNRAADLQVHINHIWSDIATLNDIRMRKDTDDLTDKLLFKYVIIEFLSLLEPLKELQQIALTSPRLIKGQSAPWRFITKREILETKRLAKEFWRGFQPYQEELSEIRNDIGAHRRLSDLQVARNLWIRLDVKRYMDAINNFISLFQHLSSINIYNWSKTLTKNDGKIALSMFGVMIVIPWEDAFDSENEAI